MSDAITYQASYAIRASDGERDQVVALLQRDFADGRLTQAELEERVGAALAARTTDQLRALTADLPGADVRPARPRVLRRRRLWRFRALRSSRRAFPSKCRRASK